MTLVTPFAAYLVPVSLGGSGVLATVATGMYIGEQRPELLSSGTRLHLASVWDVVVSALNGTLFLLTGLELRAVWDQTARSGSHLLLYGAAITATVVAVRFGWTWPGAWLPRLISRSLGRQEPSSPAREVTLIAWSGMRGAISLAAALSVPAFVQPRPLIVFITGCVIAVTLLLQGTTLPWIVRVLGLDADAARESDEEQVSETKARAAAAEAALEALKGRQGTAVDRLRQELGLVASRGGNSHERPDTEVDIEREAVEAQRRRVIQMHREGTISDLVLRRIERELDLQEAALESRVSTD